VLYEPACGASGSWQREQVEHVAHRALFATREAKLVAAPDADQEVPAPFERQRAARHEHLVRLEALAEAIAEVDVALQARAWRRIDREQPVREQQVCEQSGLERARRRAHERTDARRRTAASTADRYLSELEVRRIELGSLFSVIVSYHNRILRL